MPLRILPALALALATLPLATPAPAQDTPVEVDCDAAPGGVMCRIPLETTATLFCYAVGTNGAPVASATVVGDAGQAAFNAVRAGEIASIRCREQ